MEPKIIIEKIVRNSKTDAITKIHIRIITIDDGIIEEDIDIIEIAEERNRRVPKFNDLTMDNIMLMVLAKYRQKLRRKSEEMNSRILSKKTKDTTSGFPKRNGKK